MLRRLRKLIEQNISEVRSGSNINAQECTEEVIVSPTDRILENFDLLDQTNEENE